MGGRGGAKVVPVVVSYIHTNDDTAATTTADHNVQVVTVSSRTDRTTDASVPVTVTSYICSVQIGESAFTKNKHTVKGSFPKKSETEKDKKELRDKSQDGHPRTAPSLVENPRSSVGHFCTRTDCRDVHPGRTLLTYW